MNNILFLSAPLVDRIWGGTYFKDTLHVADSDHKIGEMWTVSALPGYDSYIKDGAYKGQTLKEVYNSHRELFNNSIEKEFPILIKIIATSDDLSVQVHPDDEYAKRVENCFGKTEGWLILDAKDDSSIIIGHNAKSKKELEEYVKNDDYEHLLIKRKVNVGEFYPIPSGTIHALGKDIVLLEVQQSSNITYRFYDYHRKDANGNERELHVKKAIEVTSLNPYNQVIENYYDRDDALIWQNEYFKVNMHKVNKEYTFDSIKKYLIVSVVKGNVEVDNHKLSLGDSFILCSGCKNVKVTGEGIIVTTEYNK